MLRLVGTSRGDVGVLVATNRQVDEVTATLRSAGVPVVSLKDYDGKPVDAVKVGTIKRAKGLEFKQVLLAHVPARLLAPVTGDQSEAARERRELDRRELRRCDACTRRTVGGRAGLIAAISERRVPNFRRGRDSVCRQTAVATANCPRTTTASAAGGLPYASR
ncbi:hypothetical protein NY588_14340 [Curtobacterium flaccumfaciens pv. beticola]|uniref:hypothetical protein n=1 Tax=Curtobacterium flaccumfaciens TaxID=2035 RepID=UPI00349F83B3|nr:hypothetical protein [Curtobacterium flaccumfaciens pv. basellae]